MNTPKIILRGDGYLTKARIVLEELSGLRSFKMRDMMSRHHVSSSFSTALRASGYIGRSSGMDGGYKWIGPKPVTDEAVADVVNRARFYSESNLVKRSNSPRVPVVTVHRPFPGATATEVQKIRKTVTTSILWGLYKTTREL